MNGQVQHRADEREMAIRVVRVVVTGRLRPISATSEAGEPDLQAAVNSARLT